MIDALDPTLPLACGNAIVTWDLAKLTVADFAPLGLIGASMLLHRWRNRRIAFHDAVLTLVLGVVGGPFVGGLLGFKVWVSAFGYTAIPVLGLLMGWLLIRSKLFAPALSEEERLAEVFGDLEDPDLVAGEVDETDDRWSWWDRQHAAAAASRSA